MGNKANVSVKCEGKDLFDAKLKSGLLKIMGNQIAAAINTKSGGKLSTKEKSDKGFILTASLALKADNKQTPHKLDAKIAFIVMTVGSTTKAFTGSAAGATDELRPSVQAAAEDLVSQILDSYMPKVIKAMVSL